MPTNLANSQLLFLNITNIVLALVVVVCAAAIGFSIFGELIERRRKRAGYLADVNREFGPHALLDPNLGLTMADGGEPLKPSKPATKR